MYFYYVMMFLVLVSCCSLVAILITALVYGLRALLLWMHGPTMGISVWRHAAMMLVVSGVSLLIGGTLGLMLFGDAQ